MTFDTYLPRHSLQVNPKTLLGLARDFMESRIVFTGPEAMAILDRYHAAPKEKPVST